jgi:hypothetical protein
MDVKYYLLQKQASGNGFSRSFSALDDNLIAKVLLGAIFEQIILDKSESDLDFLLNYILVLRTRFPEKKYYALEVIGTETFHK